MIARHRMIRMISHFLILLSDSHAIYTLDGQLDD